jgi:tetratricopeptide (TPR) repeat protein
MKRSACIWFLGAIWLLTGSAVADPAIGDQLGTIHFEASGSAEVREHVVRGVKLLHHMMYEEADKEFAAALKADAGCAFGYWGRAMAIVHPLWPDKPDADGLKRGAEYVGAGLALGSKSPREQAYLEAIGAYYLGEPGRDHPARLKALDTAWAGVADQFPDDLDAAAFSALFHLAPARFLPKDKSNRIQLESAAIIEKILKQIPNHPGALHYKIHAYDFPLLAGRALEVCDLYGGIAPDVPHALHMPTHIFTRRGLWDKSIEFNERSAAEARKLIVRNGQTNSHLPHALDYLAYAYLQRGQYDHADAIQREMLVISGPYEPTNRGAMAFAFAAIPARLAVERQDWTAAARIEVRQPASFPWGDSFLYCDSITRFVRALGAVRSGDLEAGRREIRELENLAQRIGKLVPNPYWNAQAETQLLSARGWLAFREGDRDAALVALRRAVEIEGSADKEAVTPGEVVPAGELLGEMLGEMGRPDEAQAAFEAVLRVSPNRFNALYGAAHAAEQAGESARAADYYRQLLTVAAAADPGNPRLEQAKAFLSARAD